MWVCKAAALHKVLDRVSVGGKGAALTSGPDMGPQGALPGAAGGGAGPGALPCYREFLSYGCSCL